MQKISSIYLLIEAMLIFDHAYPIIIKVVFSFPDFV